MSEPNKKKKAVEQTKSLEEILVEFRNKPKTPTPRGVAMMGKKRGKYIWADDDILTRKGKEYYLFNSRERRVVEEKWG